MKLPAPVLAAALLCHCSGPPPAPGDSSYRGREATAYRLGYHHGHMDGSSRRGDDFERYHEEYHPGAREAFARGYRNGYEAGRNGAPADEADLERARQNGRDAGHSDCANGAPPDHRRHRAQFTAASEASFREGYLAGYEEARRQ